MARGRRFLGQVVLVLVVMVAAFVGARGWGSSAHGTRGPATTSTMWTGRIFYHDAVDFLAANGLTSGCGAGLFCPDHPATRGQVAVLLERLHDLLEARDAGPDALGRRGL